MTDLAADLRAKLDALIANHLSDPPDVRLVLCTKTNESLGVDAGTYLKSGLFPAPRRPVPIRPAKPVAAVAVVKPEPKVQPAVAPGLREWSEVAVPESATALEALTYVPGLVGDITEWIVAGARRPNRMMALGVASVVVGTLIGRRIEGPTGSATHLYVILLAPTGYGKDRPLHAGAILMDALGQSHLLGPHEWASAPGFEKELKTKPLMVCFVDELGDELSKVNRPLPSHDQPRRRQRYELAMRAGENAVRFATNVARTSNTQSRCPGTASMLPVVVSPDTCVSISSFRSSAIGCSNSSPQAKRALPHGEILNASSEGTSALALK